MQLSSQLAKISGQRQLCMAAARREYAGSEYLAPCGIRFGGGIAAQVFSNDPTCVLSQRSRSPQAYNADYARDLF